MKKSDLLLRRLLLITGTLLACWCSALYAAEKQGGGMEEIVVTAQRVSQNIQNVPIAVTALTSAALKAKQITGASDLQMNAPNVSFTATNFGGSSFSIRGIGRLVIGGSAQSGVSSNINQIPVNSNQNAIEYYDVKRVEVLRGPQGTLFGRNATGGAVNVVTNMPNFNGFSGHINAEYGNYNMSRYKGALNIPLTDHFAVRIAGLMLHRHGFINNTAYGQKSVVDGSTLPNIGPNLDGRNLWAMRASAKWDINDNASGWIIYSRFLENDDRARITNQVCATNPIPTTGCLPNGFGFDHPNFGTTTGGIFGGLNNSVPLGARGDVDLPAAGGFPPMHYDYPQPADVGYRTMHTDFQPVYQNKETLFMTGWNYDWTNYHLGFLGAYQKTEFLAQQDYLMDVGPTLYAFQGMPGYVPGTFTPGHFPTSAPNGGAGAAFSGPCNAFAGTSGVEGGCIYPANDTRQFAYDQSDSKSKYWTMELKLRSSLSGPFNFQVGMNSYHSRSRGDYYVLANTLDLVTSYGVSGLGFPPLYPGFYDSTGSPEGGTLLHGYAAFGEVYFDLTPALKLTVGGRYSADSTEVRDTGLLFNAVNVNHYTGATGAPLWSRITPMVLGVDNDPASLQLGNYYAPNLVQAAIGTAPLSAQRIALNNAVPIVPGFDETRDLYGNPHQFTWRRFTGRIGLNWQVNDNSMVYAFISRGYKPGGFNSPINPAFGDQSAATFKPEAVNSTEIGSKNMLFDSTLMLNGDVFYYNYQGMQVSQIVNNSSVNVNVNARIFGAELETVWHPAAIPNLSIDGSYSYLHTALHNVSASDPLNRTAGDPGWVTLEDIDAGSLTGVNFVAKLSDLTPAVVQEGLHPAPIPDTSPGATPGSMVTPPPTLLSPANGRTVAGTTYPTNYQGNISGGPLPVYASKNYLDSQGVQTSSGLPINLDSNRLPNSPQSTIHIGVAYTWDIGAIDGNITARWDSYWQTHSYARIFNTQGDYINSWGQNNASVTYNSTNGQWTVKAWITNINDSNNVTGKYLTSDTSGFYRNYFLTNPRLFGGTVIYNFGS